MVTSTSSIVLFFAFLGCAYSATPQDCTVSQCGIGGECVIIAPDLSRCTCYRGYNFNDTTFECADIDECIYPNAALCPFGRCINVEGTYKCRCQQGYVPGYPDGKSCMRRRETGYFGIPWYYLAFLIGQG